MFALLKRKERVAFGSGLTKTANVERLLCQRAKLSKENRNIESIFLMLFKSLFASPAGHFSVATFCHLRTCDGGAHKGRAADAQAGETSAEEESDAEYAN